MKSEAGLTSGTKVFPSEENQVTMDFVNFRVTLFTTRIYLHDMFKLLHISFSLEDKRSRNGFMQP